MHLRIWRDPLGEGTWKVNRLSLFYPLPPPKPLLYFGVALASLTSKGRKSSTQGYLGRSEASMLTRDGECGAPACFTVGTGGSTALGAAQHRARK